MALTKEDALRVAFRCAEQYKEQLSGRSLLFLCVDKHNFARTFEAYFYDHNYQHLTGLDTGRDIPPNEFFKACIDKRLSPKDISFHENGTTPLKIRMLPLLLNKNLGAAKFIGEYNGKEQMLYTERISGSNGGGIGFEMDGGNGNYVPDTLLCGDMREYVTVYDRVLATFRKMQIEDAYTEVVYVTKKYNWDKFVIPEEYEHLKGLVDSIVRK